MGDLMVSAAQKWMNATYGNDSRYNRVSENGITGWGTINGLIRALQIELGIQSTADNFGSGTQSSFKAKYPNGIAIQDESQLPTSESNVYAIIQCALWCKGYPAVYGDITLHYFSDAAAGVIKMQQDAGANRTDGVVTLNTMMALLSMNQYVKVSGGTDLIRSIQQEINQGYEEYVGLSPCDGLYGREMNKALIKVLQAIENIPASGATGTFGPTTKASCPIIPGSGSDDEAKAIKLFRWALCCNGYEVGITSGAWDTILTNTTTEFQGDMALSKTGKGDLNTWMSLLLSSGNPDRDATVCDTRFEITKDRITWLKNKQYNTVGRYISGGSFKELRSAEPKEIVESGLGFFPIFQESTTDLSYFTEEKGKRDAMVAAINATKLGIPQGTVIYFAVDTDPQDADIKVYIVPYFRGLVFGMTLVYANTSLEFYEIGIYGTRNACIQVADAGYTASSFVSDMSTGFSGNMGFKMPENWNYDQFFEETYASDWGIDKVGYSGKLPPVKTLTAKYTKPSPNVILEGGAQVDIYDVIDAIEDLEAYFIEYRIIGSFSKPSPVQIAKGVTNYLRRAKYSGFEWWITEGEHTDEVFAAYVANKEPAWLATIEKIIDSNNKEDLVYDHNMPDHQGFLDLGHFAATLEAYLGWTVIPDWWAGWGGDLVSVGKEISHNQDTRMQECINAVGMTNSNFNYADMCCDADAIKIASMVKEASGDNPLSSAMRSYYGSSLAENRFTHFLNDVGVAHTTTFVEIYEGLFNNFGLLEYAGLVNLKGGLSTTSADIEHLCLAFATYIYNKINY